MRMVVDGTFLFAQCIFFSLLITKIVSINSVNFCSSQGLMGCYHCGMLHYLYTAAEFLFLGCPLLSSKVWDFSVKNHATFCAAL